MNRRWLPGTAKPHRRTITMRHDRMFLIEVEVPCPALVAADLHLVMWRVPCSVTCTPCWAALCCGESNPCAAHRAPGGNRLPVGPAGCARFRGNYLLHHNFA
jgi:hypothetical protein